MTNYSEDTSDDFRRLVEALPPYTADKFFATIGRKYDLSHEWEKYKETQA